MDTEEVGDFPYDKANIFQDIFMTWAISLVNFYRKNPPTAYNSIKIPERMNYDRDLIALRKA